MKEVTLLEAENMKLGNPSKEEEYILTLEEKKKTFIPKSVVSKSVYDKLTSLDIKTVGDVLARGHANHGSQLFPQNKGGERSLAQRQGR